MNTKMKVALSDLKYIQSEIQKILNLQKQNTQQKGGYFSINQRLMKQTFSSGLRKGQGNISPGNRRSLFSSGSGSPKKSDRNFKSIGSKTKAKDQRTRSKKNRAREEREKYMDQEARRVSKEKDNIKINTQGKSKEQPQRYNLKISKVSNNQNKDSKQQNASIKSSSNLLMPEQSQQSAKDLIKKWMQMDRNNFKNESKPNTKTQPLKQLPKQLVSDQSQLQIVPKTPGKKRKSQSISSISEKSTSKRIKDNKYKQQQDRASFYHSPKKQQLPYYLDSNNKKPLRTDQNYLTNKYKYKTLTKEEARQEVLKQKYRVLDLQLNRIRQKMHQQVKISKEYVDTRDRLDEKSKKALNKYLRYSPLNKLMRANQKYRMEHQRSLSQNPRRTKQQLKTIKVMQSGRPIEKYWNN